LIGRDYYDYADDDYAAMYWDENVDPYSTKNVGVWSKRRQTKTAEVKTATPKRRQSKTATG